MSALLVTVGTTEKQALRALRKFPRQEGQEFTAWDVTPEGEVLKMILEGDDTTPEQDDFLNNCRVVVSFMVW